MDTLLQFIGGFFYLLNKVFLSFSEHEKIRSADELSRKWRLASWLIYLLGLPAWVIIFIEERNWIAASVETSGIPAMVLGLVLSIRGVDKKTPQWLDCLALVGILFGFAYSLYDFGGLHTQKQWLEIGLVVGFLIGTYQLAKQKVSGYLWYILMHLSCGYLMWIQGYGWLLLQQLVSLAFISDAYYVSRMRKPLSLS